MKIEKSYLAFHIKLDWESTNMIVFFWYCLHVNFEKERKKERKSRAICSYPLHLI